MSLSVWRISGDAFRLPVILHAFPVAPALLGVFAFFYLGAFSQLYSAALLIWSVVFIEWWRIKERKLCVKWGVKGAANVEMLRAEYVPEGDAWWKRELKAVAR